MKIGVLGGTFDPPHLTHLAVAKAAIEQLGLDEVIFIPTAQNPLKKTHSKVSAKRRFQMVKLMIADEPNMSISDVELSRPGPSYAVDTLQELQFARPAEYWFILGSDAAITLPEWKHPEKLGKLARLAVVLRPPQDEGLTLRYIPELLHPYVDFIKFHPSMISSTIVRDNIERGRDESHHVDPAVWQFSQTHELYARTQK